MSTPHATVTPKGEWFAQKLGHSKPRQWRKVHLGTGAETLEIRAIEVTAGRTRLVDAPPRT